MARVALLPGPSFFILRPHPDPLQSIMHPDSFSSWSRQALVALGLLGAPLLLASESQTLAQEQDATTKARPKYRIEDARVQPEFIRTHAYSEAGRVRFPRPLVPLGNPVLGDLHTRINARLTLAEFESTESLQLEFFYPQLATAAEANKLHKDLEKSVRKYRQALDDETLRLKKTLAEAKKLPLEERITLLHRFAQEQNPQLKTLEEQAEGIRKAFSAAIRRGSSGYPDWINKRPWRYDATIQALTPGTQRYARTMLIQGYASYLDELSPGQRRLLVEFMIDDRLAVVSSQGMDEPTTASYALLPSRIMLTKAGDIPPDLAASFEAINSEKRVLSKELFEAIVTLDAAKNKEQRANAIATLQALDKRHQEKLDELAPRIEELRVKLAQIPAAQKPYGFPSILPPRFREEASALVEQRFRELNARFSLAAASKKTSAPKEPATDPVLGEDSMLMAVMGMPVEPAPASLQSTNAVTPNMVASQLNALNKELTLYLSEHPELCQGQDPKRLATKAIASAGRKIQWNKNEDAYDAALLPGLSDAQRELLFRNSLGSPKSSGLPL